MGARHRRSLQVKRKGRHTTPSQVEIVAEKAGKAAPAMAFAGVIAAVPATHLTSTRHPAVARVAHTTPDAAISPAHAGLVGLSRGASTTGAGSTAARTYTVRSGDTLSSISQQFYNTGADWPWLAHDNKSAVQDADLIYPGQQVNIPSDPPADASSMSWYQPKHAVSAPAGPSTSPTGTAADVTPMHGNGSGGEGTLGCSRLEQLWEAAGGNPADATIAASIAMAESGGNQFATDYDSDGSVDRGYWQINSVNGSLSTFDPQGNAQSAVNLSANGSSWEPWVTYQTGAYQGQC